MKFGAHFGLKSKLCMSYLVDKNIVVKSVKTKMSTMGNNGFHNKSSAMQFKG